MNFDIQFERGHVTLITWTDVEKNGKIRREKKETYHSNLDQVSRYILRQFGTECESINELRDLFNKQAEELGKVILMKSPQLKRVKK